MIHQYLSTVDSQSMYDVLYKVKDTLNKAHGPSSHKDNLRDKQGYIVHRTVVVYQ